MDPLTCLSVASSVVQFVDFTFKIISGTQQLYENGRLEVHAQTSQAVEDLSKFSKGMTCSIRAEYNTRSLTGNEIELEKLCKDCSILADEMVARLKRFEVSRRGKILTSVGQVFRSIWSTEELDAMEKKLSRYRDSMNSRLLGSLRERVDQVLREQYGQTAAINDHTKQIVASALLDIHASLTRDLQAQTSVLSALLNQRGHTAGGSAGAYGSIVADVRERSSGHASTKEEEKVYVDIQQMEAQLHQSIAEAIVGSLRYETITARYEVVVEAHQKTFEWIFQHTSDEGDSNKVRWSDFVQWLRQGDGIYWINGKAGSGKSTLMKYIYENPKTQEHLLVWAGENPLHVAMFFFWWGGTKIQKSQEGLLRSLLYDVLHQIPGLVPHVFPSQWASRYAAKTNNAKLPPIDIWTTASLSKAFQALISQREIPMKLCFFIDGLDEYDGLEVDIAKIFKGVVLSPNVKVCVSSRPHIPFEDAFAGRPKLRLQDLTNDDIYRFIEDRLVHDEMMVALATKEPLECQKLVGEIADAAQGVFLWVMLVVTSLINGLSNHDRISDLQLRLKTLPKDLDELYEQMVLKIDGIYQEEASRFYQLIAEATEQPGDWKPAELLSIYTLFLAMKQDLDLAQEVKQSSLDDEAILEECRRMDVLLRTRCGGLLEIQYGKSKTANISSTMKVSYLHRTVRDFLEARETRQVLLKRTGGADKEAFNPTIAIFKSIIIQVKDLNQYPSKSQQLTDQGLTYARRIDINKRVSSTELVGLLEVLSQVAKWQSMLPIAIQCCLRRYLELKLEDDNVIRQEGSSRLLLDYALVPTADSENFVSPEMVSTLFKFGANPNKRFNGWSPWQNALSYLILNNERLREKRLVLIRWNDIIKVLLENGADPTAYCQGPSKFSYRGKMKRKVDIGNEWSALEVIAKIYEELPSTRLNLERLLKKAVEDSKNSQKKGHSPATPYSQSPLNRIALNLNDSPEQPDSTNANLQTPPKKADTSFRCGSCCQQ